MMKGFEVKFNNLLIDKFGVTQEDIKPDANFITDLGADSLDMVELIMEFENEFTIVIPDKDAEQLTTVGEAMEYLRTKL
jgi:acyl carrier protein